MEFLAYAIVSVGIIMLLDSATRKFFEISDNIRSKKNRKKINMRPDQIITVRESGRKHHYTRIADDYYSSCGKIYRLDNDEFIPMPEEAFECQWSWC